MCGALVSIALAAHLPPIRARVLTYALTGLERNGILGKAESLDYNLATLDVRVRGLSLATPERPDQPFLATDLVRINLRWSTIWGARVIDAIAVDRLRLNMRRGEDGSMNLPSTPTPASDEARIATQPPAFDIRRIDIHNVAVRFQDFTSDSRVEATAISGNFRSDAEATSGTLRFGEPVYVLWRNHETSVRMDEAELAYDGRDLTITKAGAAAQEGSLVLSGRLQSLLSVPQLSIDYRGVIDTAAAASWIDASGWDGALDVSGQVRGPATAPAASVEVASRNLIIPALGPATLTTSATLSSSAIHLDGLDLSVAGGDVSGTVHVEIDDQLGLAGGRASLTWRNLSLDRLVDAWEPAGSVRFASVLGGDLEATWPRLDAGSVAATVETSLRPTPGPGLGLGGRATLRARDGRWTFDAQHEIRDGLAINVLATLEPIQDFWNSALGRSIQVATEQVASATDLVSLGLGTEPERWPVQGRMSAEGSLSGTIGVPRLELSVDGHELRYADSPAAELTAKLTLSPEMLRLTALAARTELATLEATGQVELNQRRLAATVDVDVGDLSRWAGLLPPWAAPSGAMTFSSTVEGERDRPTVSMSASGSSVAFAGQSAERLTATARFERGTFRLEDLHVFQASGSLSATGGIDLETRHYTAAVRGDGLVLRPLPSSSDDRAGLSGEGVSFEFDGQGSMDDPEGQGRFQAAAVAWNGMDLGAIDGSVAVTGDSVSVHSEAARVRARANGTLTVAGESAFDRFQLDVQLADAQVMDLFRLAGVDTSLAITGVVTADARATGVLSDLGAADIEARVSTLDVGVDDTRVSLDRPARFRYAGATVFVDELTASIGGSTLRLGGALGPTQPGLLAAVSGDLRDFEDLATLTAGTADPIAMHGGFDVAIRAAGALGATMIEAEFSTIDASIARPQIAPLTIATLRGSVRDGLITVDELRAAWQGASVTATASLPLSLLADRLQDRSAEAVSAAAQGLRAAIAFQSITPAVLRDFVDPEVLDQIDGLVTGTLTVQSDSLALSRWQGELQLSEASVQVGSVAVRQQRPTLLTLEQNELRIDSWIWRGLTTDLSLSGGASLGAEPVLDVRAIGQLDLRLLAVLMPQAATAGRADIRVIVHGPVSDLELDGTVILQDGEFRLADPRVVITALGGTLAFDRSRLLVHELEGMVNGGTLALGGELQLAERSLSDDLSIKATEMALDYPTGLRSEVDADLTLAVREDGLALTGSVTVLRGIYEEPVTLAGGLLAVLRQQQGATVAADGSILDRLRLDVRLRTLEEIVVDNNLVRLQLTGDVRLGGTAERPSLLGRAALLEGGLVFLSGNTYQVETGAVDFTSPSRIEPHLTLRARTRVRAYDITLAADGTPSTLKTDLSADDPRLTESDIVSLLLTGRKTAELGSGRAGLAREQALTLVGGELFGVAGRSLGLDAVRIERGSGTEAVRFDPSLAATEIDPGARLTFSKQLANQVQLFPELARERTIDLDRELYAPAERPDSGHRARRKRSIVRFSTQRDIRDARDRLTRDA